MFHMLCDGPIIYYMYQSDLRCNTKVSSQEDQQVRGEMTLVFYLIFLDTHKILFLWSCWFLQSALADCMETIATVRVTQTV